MRSIVVALVFQLLYWIIYCTGLAIGKKQGEIYLLFLLL